MSTGDARRTDRTRRVRCWAPGAAAVAVGAVLLVAAGPAAAEGAARDAAQEPSTSSLQIVPDPAEGAGPASCAAAGGPDVAVWREVRFATLPAVGGSATASSGGITATITRRSVGTASFVSTVGVDLVVVSAVAGETAGGATFRYDPAARGAGAVSGRDPGAPIGSVLLCVSAAPAPGADEAAQAPKTVVRDRTIARPVARPQPAHATTLTTAAAARPALPRLPETGSATSTLLIAGATLLGLGTVAAAVGRTRRLAPDR